MARTHPKAIRAGARRCHAERPQAQWHHHLQHRFLYGNVCLLTSTRIIKLAIYPCAPWSPNSASVELLRNTSASAVMPALPIERPVMKVRFLMPTHFFTRKVYALGWQRQYR
jgi:hypothetical protein